MALLLLFSYILVILQPRESGKILVFYADEILVMFAGIKIAGI